jgi:hypothetical protein
LCAVARSVGASLPVAIGSAQREDPAVLALGSRLVALDRDLVVSGGQPLVGPAIGERTGLCDELLASATDIGLDSAIAAAGDNCVAEVSGVRDPARRTSAAGRFEPND